MITAIDTNGLLEILAASDEFCQASAEALEGCASAGPLVVCDVVYTELCVHFARQRECDEFLDSIEIRVEPLSRGAQWLASRSWVAYRSAGGQRSRILPDFLIGAHARTPASGLLTRDRGFYRRMFAELEVVDPSSGRRNG